MPERKVYRFRIDPTADQEAALARYAGARRFVFNWALQRRKETYQQTGKSMYWSELSIELTELKNKPGCLLSLAVWGATITKKPKKALRFQRGDEFGAERSNA